MKFNGIEIPEDRIAESCRRNQIRELAVFGSAVRGELRADSDIDLLVVFEPDAVVGFLALGRIRRELSAIIGRKVDLVMKDGLKPLIRDEVVSSSRALYAA
jgi:predicted nucleotidyltransferase